jgi:hypothetical protein
MSPPLIGHVPVKLGINLSKRQRYGRLSIDADTPGSDVHDCLAEAKLTVVS